MDDDAELAASQEDVRAERALVLSDQRKADLATVAAADVARSRAEGKKEAEDAQDLAETKAHFATINGSQADMSKALQELVKDFAGLRAELHERDVVNAALVKAAAEAAEKSAARGAKKLSRVQLALGVLGGLGVLVSVIAFVTQAI